MQGGTLQLQAQGRERVGPFGPRLSCIAARCCPRWGVAASGMVDKKWSRAVQSSQIWFQLFLPYEVQHKAGMCRGSFLTVQAWPNLSPACTFGQAHVPHLKGKHKRTVQHAPLPAPAGVARGLYSSGAVEPGQALC